MEKEVKLNEQSEIETVSEKEVFFGKEGLVILASIIKKRFNCSDEHAKWIIIHAMDDLNWRSE